MSSCSLLRNGNHLKGGKGKTWKVYLFRYTDYIFGCTLKGKEPQNRHLLNDTIDNKMKFQSFYG